MARLNTSAELWDYVSECGVFVDDPTPGASTTTDAVSAAGQPDLSVTSETGIAADEFVRVGSGENLEVCEVESAAAGTLTMKSFLAHGRVANEAVVEQVKTDVGHIAEGGINVTFSEDVFEVRAATSATILSRRSTAITATIEWPGILWSPENIALAFGIDENVTGRVSGAGTTADPYVTVLNPAYFNELKNASMYFTGVREDGMAFELRAWNVRFTIDKTSTFARNAVAELPLGATVLGAIEVRQGM